MAELPTQDTDYNLKHPKLPWQGTYPYLHVTQDAGGGQTLKSIQPGNEAYFEIQPSGSYYGHAADGSKVEAVANGTWSYSGNGASTTVDGNHDVKISGVSRQNYDSGRSAEVAGDDYHGSSGHQVFGTSDTQYHHSSGDVFNTIDGNLVTDRVGDIHENILGDSVQQVTGNRSDIVNGEWALNNQSGNVDFQIDVGKFRLKDASDILIDSDTSITLKVGQSSIVINPTSILLTIGNSIINMTSQLIVIDSTTVKVNE